MAAMIGEQAPVAAPVTLSATLPAEAGAAASKTGTEAADAAASLAELASVSLPAASIRRIAKSAAPGARFSGEAVAALHRVAQVFVCYLTDRSLHEVKLEGDKAKRNKKGPQMPVKTLKGEHVMKFLSAELPPISKKLSTLFPFSVPSEYKPSGVRLLEQLREQERVKAGGSAGAGAAGLFGAFGAGQAADEEDAQARDEPPAPQAGGKRGREEAAGTREAPAKRVKTKAEKVAAKPAAKPKVAPAKLSTFFGVKASPPTTVDELETENAKLREALAASTGA